MHNYKLLICVYDHKLGPTCVVPRNNCEWISIWNNSKNLIQDGLNTKSELITIFLNDVLVQITKFTINDERLRGKTLRCALFSFVPYDIYLLPKNIVEEIIDGFKSLAFKNDNRVDCDECNQYIEQWEFNLNNKLYGSIGRGKQTLKMVNTIGSIKGFSEILLKEEIGPLNETQKNCVINIMNAIKNFEEIIKNQKEIVL